MPAFRAGPKASVWEKVFAELIKDRDDQYLMLDTKLVRVHQQATSGKGGKDQALGCSRGGVNTKVHMLCDTLGRPLGFMLTAGQRYDDTAAKALLDAFRAKAVLADRACENNDLRRTIAGMNAAAVIPSTRSREVAVPYDAIL